MGSSKTTVTIRVTNNRNREQRIVLEPIAWEYVLPAGKTYDVVAEGDPAYPLGIDLSDEFIVVQAFDSKGARLTVFEKGVQLSPNG